MTCVVAISDVKLEIRAWGKESEKLCNENEMHSRVSRREFTTVQVHAHSKSSGSLRHRDVPGMPFTRLGHWKVLIGKYKRGNRE